ncbi:putative pentatricopeptide repeat-containing protein [Sesamum alatum]|uniref:Pentatricopeptide repeat-containing protein n=1 Tax=Sesamum alatum TaxID=300844 RepID=A0AAE1YT96_9LAMI|nr:putative pentatricopeptide repeat-containing protein [Sesamum alatum]
MSSWEKMPLQKHTGEGYAKRKEEGVCNSSIMSRIKFSHMNNLKAVNSWDRVMVVIKRFYCTNSKYGMNLVDARAIKTGFDLETSRYNFQLKNFLRRSQISEARQLFDQMPRKNTCSVNMMISCYLKSGDLSYARELFDKMGDRTAVSWTILIGGYAQNKQPMEAFSLYVGMLRTGLKPDHVTFATLLSGCDETITRKDVHQVHAQITRLGFDSDLAVCNSLVDSYCKSQSLDLAFQLFKGMIARDTITFNTMITGCSREGLNEQAIDLFSEMQRYGFRPSDFTFAALLRACVGLDGTTVGQQVHALVIKANFVWDVFVGNALLDFYSKHDYMDNMRNFFDEMPELDGVSYNIIITSYAWNGQLEESLSLFRELQLSNHSAGPNILFRRQASFRRLVSLFHKDVTISLRKLRIWMNFRRWQSDKNTVHSNHLLHNTLQRKSTAAGPYSCLSHTQCDTVKKVEVCTDHQK